MRLAVLGYPGEGGQFGSPVWERLRGLFMGLHIPDGETLYQGIAFGHPKPDRVTFDTA